MPSLLSQVVSELVLRYPSSSFQGITKLLIDSIENDILPDAIRIMKLPRPPSKMQILLERKREERRRKKYRRITLKHKVEVIEDFEHLKYKLGGSEADRAFPEAAPVEGDLDNPALYSSRALAMSFPREDIERKDGIPLRPEVGFSRFREPLEQERSNPSPKGAPIGETKAPQFVISKEIRDRIVSDFLFRDIVGSIEIRLREFSRNFPDVSFSISMKSDEEIPMWQKIVVRLAIPTLSFQRKLDVWDQVDAELRDVLHKTTQRVDASKIGEVEAFNKKLFTNVVL